MKVKRASADKIKNTGEQLNCFSHDLKALVMRAFFCANLNYNVFQSLNKKTVTLYKSITV